MTLLCIGPWVTSCPPCIYDFIDVYNFFIYPQLPCWYTTRIYKKVMSKVCSNLIRPAETDLEGERTSLALAQAPAHFFKLQISNSISICISFQNYPHTFFPLNPPSLARSWIYQGLSRMQWVTCFENKFTFLPFQFNTTTNSYSILLLYLFNHSRKY